MRIAVTGSAGFIGSRVVSRLRQAGHEVVGMDAVSTSHPVQLQGDIRDVGLLKRLLKGAEVVVHIAGYHRPYLASDLIDEAEMVSVNVEGTLALFEAAEAVGTRRVVLTSTTAVYGNARTSATEPSGRAVPRLITEATTPKPASAYGVSKLAAERVAAFYSQHRSFDVLVLRPSRFFPDTDVDALAGLDTRNIKANEFLYRRVDVRDLVEAFVLATTQVAGIGYRVFLISSKTPLVSLDPTALLEEAENAIAQQFPTAPSAYEHKGWRLPKSIEWIYDSTRAQKRLGFSPLYNFSYHLSTGFEEIVVDNDSPMWRKLLARKQERVNAS